MMNRWNKRYHFVGAREASRGTKWPRETGSTSIGADDRVTSKAEVNGAGTLDDSHRLRSTNIIVHRALILIVNALVSLVIIRSGWWPVSGSGSAK